MKCIYCLSEEGDTKDHVFPKSWYPDNTPTTVQRPTVPSCFKCNNSLGAIEKELFILLALCIQPDHPEAIGINARLLRSFGLGIGEKKLSKKVIEIRKKLLKKILKQTKPYTSSIKVFPGMGLHEGFPFELQVATPVPIKELKIVSKKIVKGLEFVLGGQRYIKKPYEVEVYYVDEKQDIKDVFELFKKHGTVITYGPGFEVERAAATDKTRSVLYHIKIWNKLIFFASVMTPDEDNTVQVIEK